MPFSTETVRNILAIALSLGSIVWGGYSVFNEFDGLKKDVSRIDKTVKDILCAVEPDTLECRIRGPNL